MRPIRFVSAVLAISVLVAVAVVNGPAASAQDASDAEQAAEEARERADVASGFVDEAIADRDAIEAELAASISKVSDLASQLSLVGAGLDRIAKKLGFAEVEMAGIQSEIEIQAVDTYMTVVGSPSISLVNTDTVEKALVARSVVEDVVASGRQRVDELYIQRRSLEELQLTYVAEQEQYQILQDQVNAEVEHLAELYDKADAAVAQAVREAQTADSAFKSALSAVALARARDEEQQRQDHRTTTTTNPDGPTTTTTTTPGTTPTTISATTTSTGSGGGGGPWDHPPQVEQWRSLVAQHFPSNRVEEALRIIDCESNGDPEAYNPYSGASGLFQFLPSTWASTSPKAGYAGASVFDPEPNIASAAWLANRYQQLGQYFWQAWSCRRVLN